MGIQETIPQRQRFPIPMVVDLWVKYYQPGEINPEKYRANVMRRIYRRIEAGTIVATRAGLGEPFLIERAEVIRLMNGDIA